MGYITTQRKADYDGDGILDDEDNCPNIFNPDQEDKDEDGVGDVCDNCLDSYNSSQNDSDGDGAGDVCDPDADNDGTCNPGSSDPSCSGVDNCPKNYNPNQEDNYPPQGNGIGDACECEGDFNCDGNVNAVDAGLVVRAFEDRRTLSPPCTNENQCNGDFDCNGYVDKDDKAIFYADFGRGKNNNPCPACEVVDWCVYP